MNRYDIHIERLRRSGPGGQHRNRRATGIRLTHMPTGIVIMATERRSQAENLKVAMDRLTEEIKRRNRPKKKRIKTQITKASKERRIRQKKHRSEIKSFRRRYDE